MKTIFFLLPTSITIRNFFFTGVLDRLVARHDVRVVAVTRAPDILTRYRVNSAKLLVERLPARRRYSIAYFLQGVLRRRFYRIYETVSLKILLKEPLWGRLRRMLPEHLLSQPFPRSKTVYRWVHTLEDQLYRVESQTRELFNRFNPCLVVSTHPTAMDGYNLLKYALKTGVPSVGIIKSWDNLTTKGYIPVPMDFYIVWNEIMKEEVTKLHRVPADRVGVTGIPQFDPYADTVSTVPREEFFFKLNLDPTKKTILYATSDSSIAPEDPEILQRLVDVLDHCRSGAVQILARLHQLDTLERYSEVNHPNLAFHVPGDHMGTNANERLMDPNFITDLRDTLYHTNVVVNTCSTMSLDAIALDRPVVNIAFDLEPKEYYRSTRRYYDFDHFQSIRRSGATKIAGNFDEFVSMILGYLDNPELESLERQRLRDTHCYKVDGQSGQRMVDYLLHRLDY